MVKKKKEGVGKTRQSSENKDRAQNQCRKSQKGEKKGRLVERGKTL